MPLEANASMLGDFASGCPCRQPSQSFRSSTMMNTMSGCWFANRVLPQQNARINAASVAGIVRSSLRCNLIRGMGSFRCLVLSAVNAWLVAGTRGGGKFHGILAVTDTAPFDARLSGAFSCFAALANASCRDMNSQSG